MGRNFPLQPPADRLGSFFPGRKAHVQDRAHDDRRLPVRRRALCAVRNARVDDLPLPDVPEGRRRSVRGAVQGASVAGFAWTRGEPASFKSSSAAERHFCCGLRHAADVPLSGRRRDRGYHRQPGRAAKCRRQRISASRHVCPGSSCSCLADCRRPQQPKAAARHARS